jgi:hypothetical protein
MLRVYLTGCRQSLVPQLHSIAHNQALEAAMKWKLVTEDSKLRNAVPSWTISLSDALS